MAAQYESVMKTINDIGTIAAPPEVQLANLQPITIEDRTRTNPMSRNWHSTENILWWAAKTYQGPFFQTTTCRTSLNAISSL